MLERLYQAVVAAKAPIRQLAHRAAVARGPPKMAKKLAEEAIEVVIDAMNGKTEAVVRESADLLYNLIVLWVAAGVKPEDVWREMERRERLLGIAEKLPKAAASGPRSSRSTAAVRKRRLAGKCAAPAAVGGELSRWKAAACVNGIEHRHSSWTNSARR